MRKILIACAAATTLAAATALAPTTADARCHGCGVAAGVIGGLAAGAIIGGAIANSPPPPYYYGPAPVYAPGPGCYYTRPRYWDEYYHVWRRGPRQLVCP